VVGKHPTSEKKATQGAGTWSQENKVIGWTLHGGDRTITLPLDKARGYIEYTEDTLQRSICPFQWFREGEGRLRRAVFAIPGAAGMFTPINEAMKGDPKFVGPGKPIPVRSTLEDLLCLLKQAANRPTYVKELCPTTIEYGGFYDTCGTCIGGTSMPLDSSVQDTVFQFELTCDIQKRFQAAIFTMADIELAALVVMQLML
jgi:hypothetical protein